MATLSQIPFTVTIDTEEEWDWSGPFPVKDYTVDNIQQLPRFQALCTQYDIRPTYFVNHAVMADPRGREVICRFADNSDVEIGMHLHPWNTPPIAETVVDPRHSFTHNLPPELQTAKLETTWNEFVEAGLRPESFRGGRYSSGPVVQQFLAANGFRVDSSICPYTCWPDCGAPDYRNLTTAPFPTQVTAAGRLWQIPLTMTTTRRPVPFWMRLLRWCESPAVSKMRLVGLLNRLNVVSRIWLNFECEELNSITWLLSRAQQLGLSHLIFTIHSSSLCPGPGPYCKTSQDSDRIFEVIEQTYQLLTDAPHFAPMTMTQLADFFEERYHESARYQPA